MDMTAILIHNTLFPIFVITCVFQFRICQVLEIYYSTHTIFQVYVQQVCTINYIIKYMDTSEVKHMTIYVNVIKTVNRLTSVCVRF